MPATTPGGYPYAEPTDPLVQWPATSQQLAEKIDTEARRLVHGSGQYTFNADGIAVVPSAGLGVAVAGAVATAEVPPDGHSHSVSITTDRTGGANDRFQLKADSADGTLFQGTLTVHWIAWA